MVLLRKENEALKCKSKDDTVEAQMYRQLFEKAKNEILVGQSVLDTYERRYGVKRVQR